MDVRRQRVKPMVRQLRPGLAGELQGAGVIEIGAGEAEVVKSAAEFAEVEMGVVGDDQVGAGEPGEKGRGDGGEFGGVLRTRLGHGFR